MKQKILLLLVVSGFILGANAQKKSKTITAYAITSAEKGNSKWTEVRLVDLNSGEEVKSIYNSTDEVTPLNARTGNPAVKKETAALNVNEEPRIRIIRSQDNKANPLSMLGKEFKVTCNIDKLKNEKGAGFTVTTIAPVDVNAHKNIIIVKKTRTSFNSNAPFATQSAACAYDKKHDRLYYTPMGINQLRYIDLKSKTAQVFYFEDESFGALKGPGDIQNQVTRMVIGSDGNGYALTNNAEHLIRFGTNKKAEITDLGALNDHENNKVSVHSGNGYGGDIIADNGGNLYLVTANRSVFKINIDSRIATYLGNIKGLPKGFTTNGAAVEKGTNVIVTSSTATSGYYIFDLKTLQAQKLSAAEAVFNASDLANSNFISEKQMKKGENKAEEQPLAIIEEDEQEKRLIENTASQNKLSIYPNPVTNNTVNLSFTNYAAGRYEAQVIDLNGKLIQSRQITINSKSQLQDINLSSSLAKGSYLVKIINGEGKILNVEKLIVQ